MKFAVLIFLILMSSQQSFSASCCGGQAALPDLITGEEHYRFSAGAQASQIIGESVDNGAPVFRESEDQNRYGSLNLSGGMLFTPTWQGSLRTQIFNNRVLGDIDVNSGIVVSDRESIMDLEPLLVWLQFVTVPTGKSVYELKSANEVPTGNGFYRLGTGLAAFTTYQHWDFSSAVRVSRGFTRTFATSTGNVEVTPGWSGDVMAASGYSIGSKFRVGGVVQVITEEPKQVATISGTTSSQPRLIWPVTIQASYFHDENQTITVSYIDETLIGPVQGVMLNRGVALNYGLRY
jgi:hypothetical protein